MAGFARFLHLSGLQEGNRLQETCTQGAGSYNFISCYPTIRLELQSIHISHYLVNLFTSNEIHCAPAEERDGEGTWESKINNSQSNHIFKLCYILIFDWLVHNDKKNELTMRRVTKTKNQKFATCGSRKVKKVD